MMKAFCEENFDDTYELASCLSGRACEYDYYPAESNKVEYENCKKNAFCAFEAQDKEAHYLEFCISEKHCAY